MSRKGLGSLLNGVEDEHKQPTTDNVVIAEPVTQESPIVRNIVALEGQSSYNKVVTDITNLAGTLEVNRALLQVATNEARNVIFNLDEAKNVLQDYKDSIDEVESKIKNATTTASSFVINATLDDTSITQLDTAHTKMLEDVTGKWNNFAAEQDKWVKDTKNDFKSIFDNGKGVWLSDRTFWTCLSVCSLLLIFFAMTIMANFTAIHSGTLTFLLCTFGLTISAVVGIQYYFSRKT
jgi:ABC-type Fe2+-enterobactin transport system substrate-binding protein